MCNWLLKDTLGFQAVVFIYSLEALDSNSLPSGKDIHKAKPLLTPSALQTSLHIAATLSWQQGLGTPTSISFGELAITGKQPHILGTLCLSKDTYP